MEMIRLLVPAREERASEDTERKVKFVPERDEGGSRDGLWRLGVES